MDRHKEYSNGEVTVLWKPEVCIHSAKCVGNLPEVFKPKDKPWIQVDNANTDAIMGTVKKCPSGALSYYMNAAGKPNIVQETVSENVKIEVLKNGPLMVHGKLSVTHDDGRIEEKPRATAFCRCGRSGNKPFCDGTHKT
ncbi:putative Fe-S cluster protein YjdI [Ulvibacter sp. MAR_2010_11]|uniref:(4Fe-4S)-binding protein n=1 Tax=Ulvibacter sp. MAR_2010_11 TaxID=1250229 RepID=UPI000C2B8F29|nr:(4Fe-4S)-binding protein [Ulvibacter sp. MAR_2010_11]PKA82274.1 putative Fe-S cluster protein YjdI [Ulvibacter sp. MAR_2010_11]